ncbi:MOS1T transposase, partial [Pseudoatta argentina]
LNHSLLEKRPEYRKRQHKIIFLHDNAPLYTAKPVRDTLEALSWKVLAHATYSPDLTPSDYHLFASMGYALAEQCFGSYEDVKNGSMNGSRQKKKILTGVVSTNYPKDGKNV